MDTSNIIALILGGTGFIISIITLVLTPWLSLRSKRLEKRLESRFELFQKILELWELSHNNPKDTSKLEITLKEINKLIQLYGYESEIKSFHKVRKSYNLLAEEYNENNRQILKEQFNKFFSIAFNAYRKELVLGNLVD